YRMLKSIALSGVVIFIIVAAVGLLFAKSFSAKVEELLRATEEVSGGRLDARVDIATSDELEKVGAGFNRMMTRLEGMVRNEQKQREALEEGEANFRKLFDDAPVGYH